MRRGAVAIAAALLLGACASLAHLDSPDPDLAGDDSGTTASSKDKSSSGNPIGTSASSTSGSAGTTASSASGDAGESTSSSGTTTSGSTSTTSSSSSTAGGPVTCDNDQQCTGAATPKCGQKNVCQAKCVPEISNDGCSIDDQDKCCVGLICIVKGTFPFTTCVKKL